MRSLAFLVAATAVLAPSLARADQCQLVDNEVASRALAALKGHPRVIQYCEPCGDKAPGEPVAVEHVALQRGPTASPADYEVTIDKREVDLAYTYVQTGLSRYENVAALAGCPTSGVSPSLRVDESTPSAVLIQADPTPVTHVQIPAADPPPAAPEIRYVIQQTETPINWLAILAICGAMMGTSTLITILILRRRRVVAMEPRAVRLVDDRTKL